jgi:hypothetical protein
VVSLGKDPNPAQTHHPRPISAAQTQQPPQVTDSTTPGLGKDPNPPAQRPKPTESTNPTQTHHPRLISATQTQQPPQATDSTTPSHHRINQFRRKRDRHSNHPEERSPATESTSLAVNHHHAGKPKPSPRWQAQATTESTNFVLQQKAKRAKREERAES